MLDFQWETEGVGVLETPGFQAVHAFILVTGSGEAPPGPASLQGDDGVSAAKRNHWGDRMLKTGVGCSRPSVTAVVSCQSHFMIMSVFPTLLAGVTHAFVLMYLCVWVWDTASEERQVYTTCNARSISTSVDGS